MGAGEIVRPSLTHCSVWTPASGEGGNEATNPGSHLYTQLSPSSLRLGLMKPLGEGGRHTCPAQPVVMRREGLGLEWLAMAFDTYTAQLTSGDCDLYYLC